MKTLSTQLISVQTDYALKPPVLSRTHALADNKRQVLYKAPYQRIITCF